MINHKIKELLKFILINKEKEIKIHLIDEISNYYHIYPGYQNDLIKYSTNCKEDLLKLNLNEIYNLLFKNNNKNIDNLIDKLIHLPYIPKKYLEILIKKTESFSHYSLASNQSLDFEDINILSKTDDYLILSNIIKHSSLSKLLALDIMKIKKDRIKIGFAESFIISPKEILNLLSNIKEYKSFDFILYKKLFNNQNIKYEDLLKYKEILEKKVDLIENINDVSDVQTEKVQEYSILLNIIETSIEHFEIQKEVLNENAFKYVNIDSENISLFRILDLIKGEPNKKELLKTYTEYVSYKETKTIKHLTSDKFNINDLSYYLRSLKEIDIIKKDLELNLNKKIEIDVIIPLDINDDFLYI